MLENFEVDKIKEEYRKALKNCQDKYLGKWVLNRGKSDYPGPGLVEAVTMSHREAVCTVRWANNQVSQESGLDLEIQS